MAKVWLHSTGDASPLAALLLPQIFPIFSFVAPCQRGASPVSVRRQTFGAHHGLLRPEPVQVSERVPEPIAESDRKQAANHTGQDRHFDQRRDTLGCAERREKTDEQTEDATTTESNAFFQPIGNVTVIHGARHIHRTTDTRAPRTTTHRERS